MEISVSILNSEDRVRDVLELNHTRASYIHIDVMDGKFVEEKSFGELEEIMAVHRVSNYKLDIHLMVDDPMLYIQKLGNMNIEFITFHLEINRDIGKIIQEIHQLGYKVGIAIKPNTDIRLITDYLKFIDMVLLMSVEPGLGGQKFIEKTVDRIRELKEIVRENYCNVLIEVDGGINQKTIQMVEDVDIAVSGSYIIGGNDFFDRVEELLNDSK